MSNIARIVFFFTGLALIALGVYLLLEKIAGHHHLPTHLLLGVVAFGVWSAWRGLVSPEHVKLDATTSPVNPSEVSGENYWPESKEATAAVWFKWGRQKGFGAISIVSGRLVLKGYMGSGIGSVLLAMFLVPILGPLAHLTASRVAEKKFAFPLALLPHIRRIVIRSPGSKTIQIHIPPIHSGEDELVLNLPKAKKTERFLELLELAWGRVHSLQPILG